MPAILAHDISVWSSRIDGRYAMGELIRRLIHASVDLKAIHSNRFLTGEANALSGWDGCLECTSGTVENPPTGRSVWEVGTGADARGKIKEDWQKRIKAPDLPNDWSPADVTYVAVAGKNIDGPDELRRELMAYPNNCFKDLRILDAVALENWIAHCPSVDAWLRDKYQVGRPIGLHALAWLSILRSGCHATYRHLHVSGR